MSGSFSTIPEAVQAIARGEVIIVVDAEDRENEGDFVCAAETVTPEVINFILNGRGQLCVSVLPDVATRCDLQPVVQNNNAPLSTAFLTPVDHQSCKTGITAYERATTIRHLANATCTTTDFVRPGHVFPLLAKQGGVLRRAGHTEASMDLARMAGLAPVGVLCEVLDEKGDRPSREYLFELAEKHNLLIVSIEQLIRYRRRHEKLVHRAAEATLPTKYGTMKIIAYNVDHETEQPVALVMGDVASAAAPLVRMHSSCFTGDLVSSLRCDCGDQLQLALEMIARDGRGAIVYLPQEGRGIGLVDKIRAYALQEQGMDTVEANLALGFRADEREYGVGIQILADLGIERVRLLTNNPKKTDAFEHNGFPIDVIDQVPILPPVNKHNISYLTTKRDKMEHQLPTVAQESIQERN
ncbi:GTP cyclohydrolase II [Aporhodopirellula aestuarii]|uniref:GTP cyclohydrolase-2 n=1 Tax=Aporhodopirellula aestuarii TaxID=2950107 RepID=A0ABT0U3R3_9BACT|nr:GTP cyclohydrolase II [Aporhodopirellula aestuarii]MCM2371548.1 GTP cyclohydrolase II [Aporhodopirellula aestuarii]